MLEDKIRRHESQQEKKGSDFIKIYEKMDAKQAAKILNDMNIHLASRILKTMKPVTAAEILGKMSSEKARKITERNLKK